MKNIILSSVAVAVLLLTGCSSNKPTVDETNKEAASTKTQPVEEVSSVQTESVSSQGVASNDTMKADSNEMTMANIESTMTSVYFDFDKYAIRQDMKETVTKDADIAKAAASAYSIKLEGNCDEWGSDEYNFALGLKRAQTVKTELVNEGVDAKRISMVSYGKSAPVCNEKTKECWQKNRRVDFKLLP
ncbi:OmpA family protein [Sulfurimonas sp. HSL-1716]|uniref:OmpA family protein n=1 Tax=Hydrocurvibacter sulfurireducens TaxID=3131937 RepID=UPI0031F924B1